MDSVVGFTIDWWTCRTRSIEGLSSAAHHLSRAPPAAYGEGEREEGRRRRERERREGMRWRKWATDMWAHWPKRTSQNLINPISSLPPIQPPQPGERPGDRRCAVVDSAPPHAVPAARGPRPAARAAPHRLGASPGRDAARSSRRR
uniref:Uncharacterized protein n=1 Tax=Oryza glumipatula TaxID=40148 RepID=A0A0E0AZR3_9ORYZ